MRQNLIPYFIVLVFLILLLVGLFVFKDYYKQIVYTPTNNTNSNNNLPNPETSSTSSTSSTTSSSPENSSTSSKVDMNNIICSSDYYNCEDFSSQSQAQQVFDFCKQSTTEDFSDIHNLDLDKDGIACEGLS